MDQFHSIVCHLPIGRFSFQFCKQNSPAFACGQHILKHRNRLTIDRQLFYLVQSHLRRLFLYSGYALECPVMQDHISTVLSSLYVYFTSVRTCFLRSFKT